MSHPLIDVEIQKRFQIGTFSKQIQDKQYNILCRLVNESCFSNMKTLEIGSWTGLSATIIGQCVQRMKGTHYCVDWFKGDINWKTKEKELLTLDVKGKFLENIGFFRLNDTIQLLEMKSEEAISRFEDNYLHFIFIDGEHTPHAVKFDITSWWSKLIKGYIMCGHDFEQTPEIIKELLHNVQIEHDIWWIRKE